MNRKTILWIYNHPLNPEAGGTERITSLVMRGLSANGHKCLGILVINPVKGIVNYDDIEVWDIYSFLKQKHVDTVINQCGHGKDMLEFFIKKGGRKWHEEGGKIITCLHFSPKPYSVCYQFQSKKNKSWLDYYVIAKTWLMRHHLDKLDQKRIGMTYRYNYENSDYFVMLSEVFRNYITESMGMVEASKLIAINNPLTFENVLDKSLLSKKKNTILVVGRMLEWQKRILFCIKAWEKLYRKRVFKNWDLKLIGNGDDLDFYREYVKKHHIERISFVGQQNPEPYYEKSKILLMSSKAEGWGLTLTEALQKGVVPIALNSSEVFKDIVTDGYDGFLVNDGAMSAFTKAIELLVSDKKLLFDMSSNALKSADKFSLGEAIKKWEKII